MKDFYSEEIINDMKGMRILANSRGVIFDMGKKHELVFDQIAKELSKQGLTVYKPEELPELQEEGRHMERNYDRDYN